MRSDETSVTCRPGYRAWLMAVVYLLLAAFVSEVTYSAARTAADFLSCIVATLVFTGIGLSAAYQAFRTRVRVDAGGISWRSLFHRARSASWEAVTDFYLLQRNALKEDAIIETAAGTVVMSTDWPRTDVLMDFVCRRATKARAREWALLGTRPGDAARTFSYDSFANRRNALLVPVVVTAAGAVTLFSMGWLVAGIVAPRSMPQPAAMFAALIAVLCALLLVGIGVSLVTVSRDTTRRRGRGERITASSDGIRFESGATDIFAPWQDVTGCTQDSIPNAPLDIPRYVVHTRSGEFDFLATLNGHFVLKKWVATALPEGVTPWRETGTGVLHVNSGRWPGGGHLFHYRTRSNLALVVFAAVMSGLLVFLHFEKGGAGVPAVVSILAVLWLAWRFWSAAIRVDDAGITHFSAFGQRFLPWDAIRTLHLHDGKRDGMSRDTVRGAHGVIAFWDVIFDVEGLRAEIRRRAHAT